MGLGCKALYDKIALDLGSDLFAKSASTVCKSAVNLADLLAKSLTDNLALSEFFHVNLTNISMKDQLNCFCDRSKLSIAVNKMMRFLCQQYPHATIVICADNPGECFRCVFQLIDKRIKMEHRNYIDNPSNFSEGDEKFDLELLSEVHQLISINAGRFIVTEIKLDSEAEQEFKNSFVFEFDN